MSTFLHFSPIQTIQSAWFYSVHSIQFCYIWPTWCSYLVHSIHFGPIQLTLVLFSPVLSYSVQFGPIRSIMSTLVLICPFILIRSYSVHFGPIRSTLVHYLFFCPIRSTLSYSVLYGPIRSTLFPFGPIRSTSSPFGPIWSICVHFNSIQSIFVYLHIEKRHVWFVGTYSKSKCDVGDDLLFNFVIYYFLYFLCKKRYFRFRWFISLLLGSFSTF